MPGRISDEGREEHLVPVAPLRNNSSFGNGCDISRSQRNFGLWQDGTGKSGL